MEQYVQYLRKSRFDRDYAELSVEETLKRHQEILDKLAKDRGYHIAKTYYEVVSGESIAARPQIQAMLEEVNAGLYTGVLVVDLERLARGNGADQAYISQVFQFSGTQIITPSKTYDPNNEFDQEYFEFGLFMSRREYKTINRRLVRGRQSSASEGKYISSIAPYGYRRIKLEGEKGFSLEPDEQEAPVVQKIFEMYTQHIGTKNIDNYLNDHRIPTRHGDLWTYSTISNIITNPVYMGKIRRGWKRQIKFFQDGVIKKYVKCSKNMADYDVFEGLHPALVSESVFHEVQGIRLSKCPNVKVRKDFELLNAFAGLIFCAKCGKRIGRTTTSHYKVPRFRCVNQRNCHNGSSNYDIVEKQIIDALRVWLKGYKVKVLTTGYETDIAACRKKISDIDNEISKLNEQMERAYNMVEQGVYTLELFKTRRSKIEGALSGLQEQKNSLSVLLTKYEQNEGVLSSLIPSTEMLLESYHKMTPQERNKLLKEILYKIEYRKEADGRIEIDLFPRLPKL